MIFSKPRQLPPWLLAAASEGKGTTGKKDKQPSSVAKRSKPPEAPPDTKVRDLLCSAVVLPQSDQDGSN